MAAAPEAPQSIQQNILEKPQPARRARILSAWMRDLIISLGISAFIIVFLYQPVKVEGTSMMPSLDDQERIFINKFVYRIERIQRGDIVVFRYHVRIADGRVFLNGRMLLEDYVPGAYEDGRSYPELTVPPDSYFVLGDHRSLSNDSRDFGPVDAAYIYGKAVFGYWPVDKVGKLR